MFCWRKRGTVCNRIILPKLYDKNSSLSYLLSFRGQRILLHAKMLFICTGLCRILIKSPPEKRQWAQHKQEKHSMLCYGDSFYFGKENYGIQNIFTGIAVGEVIAPGVAPHSTAPVHAPIIGMILHPPLSHESHNTRMHSSLWQRSLQTLNYRQQTSLSIVCFFGRFCSWGCVRFMNSTDVAINRYGMG